MRLLIDLHVPADPSMGPEGSKLHQEHILVTVLTSTRDAIMKGGINGEYKTPIRDHKGNLIGTMEWSDK